MYFEHMNSTLYLSRRLSSNDNTYSEPELLAASNYVVVLAEPGGGKTELMRSLAQQLGTSSITANVFGYLRTNEENHPLVIDAFDEMAKVDKTGVYRLFANAKMTNPTCLIISSRSSEWDNSTTNAFTESLGQIPLVVTICEFEEAEQRAIFEHHKPGEDFAAFQAEVARFDLEMLLPNPQFLKMFADAYIESGKCFTDKRSIFAQAVQHLAKEANTKVASPLPILSTAQKIDLSSEVFAKLLMSGAEGVSTSEATEDRLYPLLASLISGNAAATGILATRLFKPGYSVGQHLPVHKIVAEYCAADYLIKRVADPLDPLTLAKCIPIIAPNSTVRDELRGLLGWMAALGNKPIEVAAIELDPYAVLANGDPSQLESSSKRLLVRRLKEIETKDPYFRRGDFWRRFSAGGFFTQDVVEEIKPFLAIGSDGHLRDLILELLDGSPAIKQLSYELQQLTLMPNESENCRLLASRCLLDLIDHDHQSDLSILISEATHTSLNIAAKIIESLGPEKFDRAYIANYLRVSAQLYPGHQRHLDRTLGERYFLKRFIACLPLETIEWILDDLSKDLACVCGKKFFECECLIGLSKIVGSLLDRYFKLAKPPFEPKCIWQWLENLNFHEEKSADQSLSVQLLREDHNLRQGIIKYVFEKLTDNKKIVETKLQKFDFNSHSGLHFHNDDFKFIVDLAFDTNNHNLWSVFIARHHYHQNKKELGQNSLRRHMREQAQEKPSLMREWAKSNRAVLKSLGEQRFPRLRHSRLIKRRRMQENEIRVKNITYVRDNRELVESGRHWNCLVRFASLVLDKPEKIKCEFEDESLVRTALRNCLSYIDEYIPDLLELAELQCDSKSLHSETILYAACVEILRESGNLSKVNFRHLRALRTNNQVYHSAVTQEERETLITEVDRLIFPDIESKENFLRQYVEPQLAQKGCNNPKVGFLHYDETFSDLRAPLSIDWLRRFKNLDIGPLDKLFEIAAEHGNREDLKSIIVERCKSLFNLRSEPTDNQGDIEQKRKFWLVRAFYFLDEIPEAYWQLLEADKDTVLVFYQRTGRMNYNEHPSWPILTSRKVEMILDAFIEQWPKVALPNHYGSSSPKEENAYRFLKEVIWSISSDDPDDAINVLDRLLVEPRYADMHMELMSINAAQSRNRALRNFEPPTPKEIVDLIDHNTVVTVEGLRQLVLQELEHYQKALDGGEFNSADRFYDNGKRLNEVRSTEIIAERLNIRLEPQGISVTSEHQLKSANRCDFTVTKMISGKRRLLVTEVKGQWHDELYTAASAQLHEHYCIHPDAEQQGIYLVIWFGVEEKVAGRKRHNIGSAAELKSSIEKNLPSILKGLVDVYVLDVSK